MFIRKTFRDNEKKRWRRAAAGQEMRGIMYNYDSLWRTMKERGVTTYSLINHYNISSHTMSNIRHNENITMETLNKLCQILHCQANDVVEITFDDEEDVVRMEAKNKKIKKNS